MIDVFETPDSDSDEPDELGALADEFVARHRSGLSPSISDYCRRHPAQAERIRDLFPALLMIEEAGPSIDFDAPPADSGAPLPDSIGDFRIVSEIGRGGMGVVYEAVQESLGRRVALKVLPLGPHGKERHRQRFRREARAAARLHHSNIVPVFGVGEDEGTHYYVMQYIHGLGLDRVVAELASARKPSSRRKLSEAASAIDVGSANHAADSLVQAACPASDRSPLSDSNDRTYWRSVARLGAQAAQALDYAHGQGVLHRDIKPSNLLLDVEGNVWVTDFGLAHDSDEANLTHTGDVVGTLRYLAPERLAGVSNAASDVYSLGVTLYELLTLRPAFEESDRNRLMRQLSQDEPPPPRSLDRGIPRDLETIVLTAMTKSPARRYPTARALADDLLRFLEDRPIRARRIRRLERSWRWCRRNPVTSILLAALAIVITAAFAGVTHQWRHAERARDVAEAAQAAERSAARESKRWAAEVRDQSQRMQRAFSMLEEARYRARMKNWDSAMSAYSAAIELRPDLAVALEERGQHLLDHVLLDLAAADIQRAFQARRPVETWQWLRHALLRLDQGDQAGYQQVCREMHAAFAASGSPVFAIETVRACAAAPDSGVDPHEIVALAEIAVQALPEAWTRHQLGVAYLRAGQFQECLEACQMSLADPNWQARPLNYPILAMAHHHLGEQEQARAALRQAAETNEAWMNALCPPAGFWGDDYNSAPQWPIWVIEWIEFTQKHREAGGLMGEELADDPRLHLLRARALRTLFRLHDAEREYAQALAIRPHDADIRLEWRRHRAFTSVTQGDFGAAATEYGRALEIKPEDANLWRFQAIAQLAAGDNEAHRAACRAMLRRFANTQSTSAARAVVEACICHPDSTDDWGQLEDCGRVAGRGHIASDLWLGAVKFRSGKFQQAVDCFSRGQRAGRLRANDALILAMSLHGLGKLDEARSRYDDALAWIEEAESDSKPSLRSENRAQWGGWTERPKTYALLREAESLLRP